MDFLCAISQYRIVEPSSIKSISFIYYTKNINANWNFVYIKVSCFYLYSKQMFIWYLLHLRHYVSSAGGKDI